MFLIVQVIACIIVCLAFLQALFLILQWFRHSHLILGTQAAEQATWDLSYKDAVADLNHRQQKRELGWQGLREFVVSRKQVENESGTICSFLLWPMDERPLPPFEPGQFLCFELNLPDQPTTVTRCYSISDAPNGECYRVSIRQVDGGLVSGHFHQSIAEGDVLKLRAPSGAFFVDMRATSPVVLLAGGVGITPMLSMFKAIAEQTPSREAWLFYAVRELEDLAHLSEIRRCRSLGRNLHVYICISSGEGLVEGLTVHHGRVDTEMLETVLPSKDYDFYMCGPAPMMKALDDALPAWGVARNRIHQEAFGPASVPTVDAAGPAPSKSDVQFRQSGTTLSFDPASGSLLAQAQGAGIPLLMGCGAGSCGTCRCRILSGKVSYPSPPTVADLGDDECLPCVCRPASDLLEIDA